ncbi:hypothetical protein ACJ73_05727 [Blastomyces percursus]|uniref:Uncharacterized protein n=1 Tax=Blastomyces percursus TaxID=1658174 RepID=A0A1J9QRT5_9EURO|nr:hypothetical protein ACJ73_05727 [Blastomyces percursus]
MKVTTHLAAALAALAGGASGKSYTAVYFDPPYNWIPGPRLMPSRVLEGFNEPYSSHTRHTWVRLMKQECDGVPDCSSLAVFSAIPQESQPQPRVWYGYLFSGPEIVPRDFVRQESTSYNVRDSAAFNAYSSDQLLNITDIDT